MKKENNVWPEIIATNGSPFVIDNIKPLLKESVLPTNASVWGKATTWPKESVLPTNASVGGKATTWPKRG